MKRTLRTSLLTLALASAATIAADVETITLWDGEPPLAVPAAKPETDEPARPNQAAVRRISHVSAPTLAVYPAPAGKRNGVGVLICPGGGYNIVAIEHEGTQVAGWLNSLGVTAAVLKYRVPAPKGEPAHLRPLLDAQRAMTIFRSRAKEWDVHPDKIGALGFSAGGHLAAWLLCEGSRRAQGYPASEGDASCRPDFGVLIYPAYITAGKDATRVAPVVRAEEKPGPVFFVHAHDDRISSENSIELYLALKKAGGGGELHVYQQGGHGFGMLPKGQPINDWPQRCQDWLRAQHLIP
jgi:acetyl esterase/lipase